MYKECAIDENTSPPPSTVVAITLVDFLCENNNAELIRSLLTRKLNSKPSKGFSGHFRVIDALFAEDFDLVNNISISHSLNLLIVFNYQTVSFANSLCFFDLNSKQFIRQIQTEYICGMFVVEEDETILEDSLIISDGSNHVCKYNLRKLFENLEQPPVCLWRTGGFDCSCGITVSQSKVYVCDPYDTLKVLDLKTGNILNEIRIERVWQIHTLDNYGIKFILIDVVGNCWNMAILENESEFKLLFTENMEKVSCIFDSTHNALILIGSKEMKYLAMDLKVISSQPRPTRSLADGIALNKKTGELFVSQRPQPFIQILK